MQSVPYLAGAGGRGHGRSGSPASDGSRLGDAARPRLVIGGPRTQDVLTAVGLRPLVSLGHERSCPGAVYAAVCFMVSIMSVMPRFVLLIHYELSVPDLCLSGRFFGAYVPRALITDI